MKIILSQLVEIENDRFPHHWDKEYESTVVPMIGMKSGDPLWKDPYEYEVTEVIINYESDECYVSLAKYDITIPQDRASEFALMASRHGWKAGWAKMY